ncbi:histidine kinase [Kribbella sp. VKM Ac-2527]|uniref:histidine kinase n=1 Tax=Kribbella caucasensis TaxID=2512215 RepID=A0A4V3CAG5_9ACTN|nr:histidine kinase [Kribbella sp. VKM Ac-2527]TDO50578.1 histidine kinase [Kribbella sp. VKM Ac-2527]
MTSDLEAQYDHRRSVAATVLLGVAVAEAVLTVVASALSGLPWSRLVDLLVVSNTILGMALAVAGWPIAFYRPRNLIGWVLLLGGCCYAFTGTGMAVLAWAAGDGWGWRVFATVVNGFGWNWAVAFFIPLALVLFPDGRLRSRLRWFVGLLLVNTGGLMVAGVLDPLGGMSAELGIQAYPAPPWTGQPSWLNAIWGIGLLASYLGAFVILVITYRRGDDVVRRRMLWLVMAMVVVVSAFTLEAVLSTESLLLGILPIVLIPLSITIAVLRYQLLDIRLVVSRSLLYLLLTGGVIAAYLGLVALMDQAVRRQVSLGSSVLATLLIALAFNPVRLWLQSLIHRAFYGARRDPVRAIAAIGERLGEIGTGTGEGVGAGAGLDGVLEALCRVMHFPAASIVVGELVVAGHGELPAARQAIVLHSGEQRIGELVVGLRSGEHRLDAADERVLSLLAAPLTVAVQAGRLADELQVSRQRVISGREEERRRIRRDLHDGLGPVLTGVVLNADAALRLLEADRARSAELLANLRDQTIGAIEEIRRLAYDLRPPVLDGMGLLGALREHAAVLSGRTVLSGRAGEGALTVTVEAPVELPELPAAVEVAAYRIVTEALTNVIRHSTASRAVVTLSVAETALRVEVRDNGVNAEDSWQPGVGLTSIRERTAELGGESEIRYDRTGGQVRVSLPLPVRVSPAESELGAGG